MDKPELKCRYLEHPSERPASHGLCADINGCQGKECPFQRAFEEDRKGGGLRRARDAAFWMFPLP